MITSLNHRPHPFRCCDVLFDIGQCTPHPFGPSERVSLLLFHSMLSDSRLEAKVSPLSPMETSYLT